MGLLWQDMLIGTFGKVLKLPKVVMKYCLKGMLQPFSATALTTDSKNLISRKVAY